MEPRTVLYLTCILLFLRSNANGVVLQLAAYDEHQTWTNYNGACGNEIQDITRNVDIDGEIWESIYNLPDSCFQQNYGATEYIVDQFWGLNSSFYNRWGTLGGFSINEWENPNPFSPTFGPEWQVINKTHKYASGSKGFKNITTATVKIFPSPLTGLRPLKPNQVITLQVSVTELQWSDTQEKFINGATVSPLQLTVAGNPVDCNGMVTIEILNSQTSGINVTPVAPVQNFSFTLTPILPPAKGHSKSHHPGVVGPITAGALQSSMNTIAMNLLAADTDGCVVDSDPSLLISSNVYKDDVPTVVEFFIWAANPEQFPTKFHDNKYNVITLPRNFRELIEDPSTSDIMIVDSLPDNANGRWLDGKFAIANDYAETYVHLHEWGHDEGLDERGVGNNPSAGATEDAKAIMFPNYSSTVNRPEVNRGERAFLY